MSTGKRGEIVWLERRLTPLGFTARDRAALAQWRSDDRWAVIVDGEPAAFAMLYEGATPWASWAVARQDGTLTVWDCVTFADIGGFSCMADVLAAFSGSLPSAGETSSNVLSFATARLRASPA